MVLEEGGDPKDGKALVQKLLSRSYHSAMGYRWGRVLGTNQHLISFPFLPAFYFHRVFMDQHGDVEGNYTLVSAQSLTGGGVGLLPTGRFVFVFLVVFVFVFVFVFELHIQVLPRLTTESE